MGFTPGPHFASSPLRLGVWWMSRYISHCKIGIFQPASYVSILENLKLDIWRQNATPAAFFLPMLAWIFSETELCQAVSSHVSTLIRCGQPQKQRSWTLEPWAPSSSKDPTLCQSAPRFSDVADDCGKDTFWKCCTCAVLDCLRNLDSFVDRLWADYSSNSSWMPS